MFNTYYDRGVIREVQVSKVASVDMARKIKTLSDFKLQVKRIMKQITNLTSAEQGKALKYVKGNLKHITIYLQAQKMNPHSEEVYKENPKRKSKEIHAINSNLKCEENVESELLNDFISTNSIENNNTPVVNENNDRVIEGETTQEQHRSDLILVQSFNEKCIIETNFDMNDADNAEFSSPDSNTDTCANTLNKICEYDMDKSSGKLLCHVCDALFGDYDELLDHLFNHVVSPRSCRKCKNCFNNGIVYTIHLNEDCGLYNAAPMSTLYENFIKTAKNTVCKGRSVLMCQYCGDRFYKLFNLKRHLLRSCGQYLEEKIVKLSQNMFECVKCRISFPSLKKYSKHLKLHQEGEKQCSKCDSTFPTRKLLRAHNLIHKQMKIEKYKCNQCDIIFPNRVTYRNHIKTFKNDPSHIQNLQSTGIWCEICKECFYDEYTYERHCSRKKHLMAILPNTNIFKHNSVFCEKCGAVFLSKSALSTHNLRIHSGKENIVECEQCKYTTRSKSNMLRHVKSVHTIRYKKYGCDKCPAMFASLSSVNDHLKSVHCELRQFACDTCLKSFKLKSQLTRHKTIHNSSMPFTCALCTMGFKRQSHLIRHTKSKHKDDIIPKAHGVINLENNISCEISKENKLGIPMTANPAPDPIAMSEDRVFSLIDVHSGELVTLSATELSKNAVINMEDGALLNAVHLRELWQHPADTIYSMDPLQGAVIPQTEYNIITNNSPEMTCVLEKTLQNQISKESLSYVHQSVTELRHPVMEHTPECQQMKGANCEASQLCVCVYSTNSVT